jgi:membrane-associated phospholipid phosphatase
MNKFERIYHAMTKLWVVVFMLSLIILSFLYFDKLIASKIVEFKFEHVTLLMKLLSSLGVGVFYITLLFVAALSCRYIFHNKFLETRFWALWLCVTVPNLVCLVLKTNLGRARPELLFSDNLYGFYGFHTSASYLSFPSGHTTTIMGLVFGLSALFPRYCVRLIVLGLLVAFSRVFLVQHYLSDVLAAGYLALIEVGLLYSWFKPKLGSSSCARCVAA